MIRYDIVKTILGIYLIGCHGNHTIIRLITAVWFSNSMLSFEKWGMIGPEFHHPLID